MPATATELQKPIRRRIGELLVEVSGEGVRLKRRWDKSGWHFLSYEEFGRIFGVNFDDFAKGKRDAKPRQ